MIDRETLRGWTEASTTKEIDAKIHPAGVNKADYLRTGQEDAERVMKWVKDGDRVLDYGCGNGRVMQFIPNSVGVDAVEELAKSVNGFLPENFTEQVDVIYSISVFIHNTYETGKEVIKWMKEHLKPGGLMLLQIPIYETPKAPGCWIDVGVWTEEQFRKAVDGLEIIELHTNKGSFSFETIGENHYQFQVLKK